MWYRSNLGQASLGALSRIDACLRKGSAALESSLRPRARYIRLSHTNLISDAYYLSDFLEIDWKEVHARRAPLGRGPTRRREPEGGGGCFTVRQDGTHSWTDFARWQVSEQMGDGYGRPFFPLLSA